MYTNNTVIDIDGFTLGLEGPLVIEMPPMPEVTSDDIDAQLFAYVANARQGSPITTIYDLDDAWASESFPGINTMQELRSIIEEQIRQDNAYGYQNLKYARCADALVAALEGEIPQEAIDANLDEVRKQSEMTIRSYGESLPQYLSRNGLSEKEFEAEIVAETEHVIALNVALDILVRDSGEEIEEHELLLYLSVNDIDSFFDEARETGKLDVAKQAAARVKTMRALIDAACIV